MRLAIIVAKAENNVIGRGCALPWHLSSDLKHFRRLTFGKPVIMGRKTFQSMGKPLVGRDNIVVTRDPDFHAEGITVVNDIEQAMQRGKEFARERMVDEIMVIGGGEIYRAVLDKAKRIYLTEVHARPEGDTFFPEIDPKTWRETLRRHHYAGPRDDYNFSLVVLVRPNGDD
jgi:dihydrofolate reductase